MLVYQMIFYSYVSLPEGNLYVNHPRLEFNQTYPIRYPPHRTTIEPMFVAIFQRTIKSVVKVGDSINFRNVHPIELSSYNSTAINISGHHEHSNEHIYPDSELEFQQKTCKNHTKNLRIQRKSPNSTRHINSNIEPTHTGSWHGSAGSLLFSTISAAVENHWTSSTFWTPSPGIAGVTTDVRQVQFGYSVCILCMRISSYLYIYMFICMYM